MLRNRVLVTKMPRAPQPARVDALDKASVDQPNQASRLADLVSAFRTGA